MWHKPLLTNAWPLTQVGASGLALAQGSALALGIAHGKAWRVVARTPYSVTLVDNAGAGLSLVCCELGAVPPGWGLAEMQSHLEARLANEGRWEVQRLDAGVQGLVKSGDGEWWTLAWTVSFHSLAEDSLKGQAQMHVAIQGRLAYDVYVLASQALQAMLASVQPMLESVHW